MVQKAFKLFFIITIFLVIQTSCNFGNKTSGEATVINFSEENKGTTNSQSSDTVNKLSVAVAAIISPRETFSYYEDLLKYVSHKIDYKLEFKQRKTYQEVNRLIENNEVDLAFICSGAYI